MLIKGDGLVKTTKFSKPKYVGDPINAVRIFNDKKVDELMLLDISSKAKGFTINFPLLKKIASQARMPLCYGGGVNTVMDVMALVSIGFEKVSFSSEAVKNPDILRDSAEAVGSQSVVLTLDVKRNQWTGKYEIYTCNGSKKESISLEKMIEKAEEYCIGELIINSIDRDGTMTGYDLELAAKVRSIFSGPLTILGGAGSVYDFTVLESAIGICGAAAGSLFVFKGKYRAVLISYFKPSNAI